jgi:hypothetical protein
VALATLGIGWAAMTPVEPEPVERAWAAPPVAAWPGVAGAEAAEPATPALPVVAVPDAAAPSASPVPPALSTMVAPGVHITPLSVPPGTVPLPAGPTANDSEPEN